jgi:hypothetical protein
MGKASFDDLLLAFRSALLDAQEALGRKSEEAQRLEAEGFEGGQAPALRFAIPKIGSEDGQYEVLTLPVSSFRRQCRPQVTMLSLSFECELNEEWFPCVARVFRVVVGPGGAMLPKKAKRRKMQVIFHGSDSPCGEVRLEGDVLMRLPEAAGAGEGRPAPKAKQSLLARAATLFRKLWPQHGYAMTVEQSMRVRQILAHSTQRS